MIKVNYWYKNSLGMNSLTSKEFDDLDSALRFASSVAYDFYNITLDDVVLYSEVCVKPHFVTFYRFHGNPNK